MPSVSVWAFHSYEYTTPLTQSGGGGGGGGGGVLYQMMLTQSGGGGGGGGGILPNDALFGTGPPT
jgi:hypothetical protein